MNWCEICAYDERLLPCGELDPVRLAALADALEEAGCNSDDVLGHLSRLTKVLTPPLCPCLLRSGTPE